VLEQVLSDVEEKVIRGGTLSKELARHTMIPSLMSRMIAVGEEGGDLPSMLHRLGDLYAENLEKRLQRITTLAQPVILVVMGGIIGLVMLAILLPLTDVTSLF